MPTNQLVIYNRLLELLHGTPARNIASIRAVFNRDFVEGPVITFYKLPILPRPTEDSSPIEQLFWHLTTVEVDNRVKKRAFDTNRALRIHWIKHHLITRVHNTLYFKVKDENRVYILDQDEKYLVVLDPSRAKNAFYLLTAFHLGDSGFRKVLKKYEKRGEAM